MSFSHMQIKQPILDPSTFLRVFLKIVQYFSVDHSQAYNLPLATNLSNLFGSWDLMYHFIIVCALLQSFELSTKTGVSVTSFYYCMRFIATLWTINKDGGVCDIILLLYALYCNTLNYQQRRGCLWHHFIIICVLLQHFELLRRRGGVCDVNI